MKTTLSVVCNPKSTVVWVTPLVVNCTSPWAGELKDEAEIIPDEFRVFIAFVLLVIAFALLVVFVVLVAMFVVLVAISVAIEALVEANAPEIPVAVKGDDVKNELVNALTKSCTWSPVTKLGLPSDTTAVTAVIIGWLGAALFIVRVLLFY